MTNYLIYLDETIHGPLSADVIESRLRAGTILPDTLAAAEGSPEWTTADELFHFQSLSARRRARPACYPVGPYLTQRARSACRLAR